VPVELEAIWLRAAESSANLRKSFEQKMTYEGALDIGKTVEKEKIRTPEFRQAQEFAEKAKCWTEKAQSISKKFVTMKTLQRLVNEAKSIPVHLPKCEEVKQRFEKAHEW
jgi:hypothetical protein